MEKTTINVKNIWTETDFIHVDHVRLEKGETKNFPESFGKSNECKKLLKHGYIQIVKDDAE